MRRSVVVFDFDKTLTQKDTLFGFYKAVAGSDRLFFLKKILLIAAGVLYKAGAINNHILKRLGIGLFLKGKTRDELEAAARRYSAQIELNDIFLNYYQKTNGEKWIVSASPEVYLKYMFPGEQFAGTTFTFSGDTVKGLETNMFGKKKKRFLSEKGITRIHEFYTDSFTDKPLMDIADKVYLVENGEVRLINPKKTMESE